MSTSLVASGSRSRTLGLLAFAIMLLLATLAMPVLGLANTVRTDTDVTVGRTEVIQDDLYVMSDTLALNGRAERDVFAAARMAEIGGRVNGSLNILGGNVTVSGVVGHSVRVASGTVTISGTVSGDLLVLGGTVQIADGAEVTGDVQMYGGALDMLGVVGGDVTGTLASLELDGEVRGSVNAAVEQLNVGDRTRIQGELEYVSSRVADIPSQAEIAGAVEQVSIAPWGLGDSLRAKFFSPLVRTVWLLVTGALIIALAPRLSASLNENLRRPDLAGLAGIIGIVGIPAFALLLLVTIVGIPAGLLVMAAYLITLYLSQVIVGQRIGAWLMPTSWNDGSRGHLLLSMTIGVVLIGLLRYVPVPYIGSIVSLLIAILGMGSVVMLLRQLRPRYVLLRNA